MTLPKLTASAPEGLVLIPESDWTEYEKRIWDGFGDAAESILQGTPPYNNPMAVGQLNGRTVLLARIFYARDDEEQRLYSHNQFNRFLRVGTTVFLYPEARDGDYFETMHCFDENIIEGDGEYDVFKDSIPEGFMPEVSEMFEEPSIWNETELKLNDYVNEQIGGVGKIVDPKVRAHIIEVIANGD